MEAYNNKEFNNYKFNIIKKNNLKNIKKFKKKVVIKVNLQNNLKN